MFTKIAYQNSDICRDRMMHQKSKFFYTLNKTLNDTFTYTTTTAGYVDSISACDPATCAAYQT